MAFLDNVLELFNLNNKIIIPDIEEYLQPKEKINITVNKKIREKYKKGWIKKTRPKPPLEITLHGTGGGNTMSGFLKWIWNGERSNLYNRGIALFHYIIDKEGNIEEIIDPDYFVYHSTSGRHAKVEIGIELMNSSKSNRDAYTQAQYENLFDLIDHLKSIYPSIEQISTHRFNIWRYNRKSTATKYDKQCPGTGFDWTLLEKYYGKTFKIFHT